MADVLAVLDVYRVRNSAIGILECSNSEKISEK